jgi:hypothetical protein
MADCASISIGSPKEGQIARNSNNHRDRWLVAQAYFKRNYDPDRVD